MNNSSHRHPRSLGTFFATEMWERYGYYVVQTLLALYLALHLQWQDKQIYDLVGSFTALTYIAPLIGGWIADHLLGQKRAIITGAVILFLSYLSLSIAHDTRMLTFCLASIAVGTGLLKPNISSLLGNEYPEGSSKRESGFTIFYMGITTGIILGSTLPGILRLHFGWSGAFLSAAIGMILAIVVFVYGMMRYRIADYHPYEHELKKTACALGLIGMQWIGAYYILTIPAIANVVFAIVVVLATLYLLGCIRYEPKEQARKTFVIAMLCLISTLFWALYFQMFLALTLFLHRVVQPLLLGVSFPPPYYVGVESIGMLIFGGIIALRKVKHVPRCAAGRTANQFLSAMMLMSLFYAAIVVACRLHMNELLLSPVCIIPAYLLIALAELLLSPVGLAAITLLASRKKVSTMVGIFFTSLGIGGFLAGKLAKLAVVTEEHMSVLALKQSYAQAFTQLFYVSLLASAVCVCLNFLIKRMMKNTQ